MKKTKTLFDQAIEIIEAGGMPYKYLLDVMGSLQDKFFRDVMMMSNFDVLMDACEDSETFLQNLYTRLLLARELWNDGQEKYWKKGKFY